MKLRELFSEMPYGAALSQENLHGRCSTCFASVNDGTKIPCKGRCNAVVYCGEKCEETDEKIHEFECMALRKRTNIDAFVRLLARVLTRRRIDRGVAHLADNFPSNIPDRRLSDLMSHRSDIEANAHRSANMRNVRKEFRDAFEGTELAEAWDSTLYCVMMINCFSVSGSPHLENGHESWIGLGFYSNTSRFNHSCRPDLYVDFDDARLVVRFPSNAKNEEDANRERSMLTKSTKTLNRLTLNYGYAHSFTTDSFFPLRDQRRASLEYGYYFRCRCILCSSETETMLERHAAALECSECGEPYVWKKTNLPLVTCCVTAPSMTKFVREKSCRCRRDGTELDDAKVYTRSLDPDKELPALEQAWSKAMAPRIQEMQASELVKLCEPVLMKALYFWHRWGNLRLAQLNERLFVAYNTLIASACEQKEDIDRFVLKMALETGLGVIEYGSHHPVNASYHTIMAAYAYRLGRLYELSSAINESNGDAKSAAHCYLRAAAIWETLGTKLTDQMVAKLRAMAEHAVSGQIEC